MSTIPPSEQTLLTNRYHHYLFFTLEKSFYEEDSARQEIIKLALKETLERSSVHVTPYATLGFKAESTLLLWCRAADPSYTQNMLRDLLHTPAGQHITLVRTLFGISKASPYSGRTGKPEQDMTINTDRYKYFTLYPFTKTHEWYQLDPENRKAIMGQHIKTGIEHSSVRQCLLYSYGVDDHEFIVSYEMQTLEEFQEVVVRMRSTIGRTYTKEDTPLFTGIYKPLEELLAWL